MGEMARDYVDKTIEGVGRLGIWDMQDTSNRTATEKP